MLGKLIKNETIAMGRKYLIFLVMLVIATGAALLAGLLPGDNRILMFVQTFIQISCFVAFIVVLTCSFFYPVIRFYQNMVTGEGYLMFTLPAKTWQLTMSKLVVGSVFSYIMILLTFGSVVLIGKASFSGFFGKAFEEMKGEIFDEKRLLLVFIVLMLIAVIAQFSFLFLSVAIGQMVPGNKALGSVIAYAVVYAAIQFCMLAIIAVVTLIVGLPKLTAYFDTKSGALCMLFLIGVMMLVFGVVSYILTNKILKKKLNLN